MKNIYLSQYIKIVKNDYCSCHSLNSPYYDRTMNTCIRAMMVLILALLLGTAPGLAQTPENAKKTGTDRGWECDRGYRQANNLCVKVDVPTNGRLDYTGHKWECNRGFRRNGQTCDQIRLPDNASFNYTGNGWTCNRGFKRSAGTCIKVTVPDNATLSNSGNSWDCNLGFRRDGNNCTAITIPLNAKLTYSGRSWECIAGFLKRSLSCIPVSRATDAEIRQALINASTASYPGNCPCPYFADRAGRSCGGRSAWSRAGGYSPLCYPNDISPDQVRKYRNAHDIPKSTAGG
jgi:hypothetical protein